MPEKTIHPNIVIMYADDLGFGDLGCYGATKVPTPNLDRLASESLQFSQGYATVVDREQNELRPAKDLSVEAGSQNDCGCWETLRIKYFTLDH